LIGLHQGPFERVRRCIRTRHADGQREVRNGPNI
jgi:hypothetical protein